MMSRCPVTRQILDRNSGGLVQEDRAKRVTSAFAANPVLRGTEVYYKYLLGESAGVSWGSLFWVQHMRENEKRMLA